MQSILDAISLFERVYCTRQTGVLTRGMTSRAIPAALLALADELRQGTIERIIGMSDIELSLQALLDGGSAIRR